MTFSVQTTVRKWQSVFEVMATLFFGLIKDHPFHDANKRTAFLSLLYYLEICGRCPTCTQQELENFAVEVADNGLVGYDRFDDLVKRGDSDPKVRFISHYLKKNTRELDKRHYTVTFRELATILARYDLAMENPHKNSIDVLKYEERSTFLGLGPRKKVVRRIANVGFPGWSRQVDRSTLKAVREVPA